MVRTQANKLLRQAKQAVAVGSMPFSVEYPGPHHLEPSFKVMKVLNTVVLIMQVVVALITLKQTIGLPFSKSEELSPDVPQAQQLAAEPLSLSRNDDDDGE